THARATATIPVWQRQSPGAPHQGVDPPPGPARSADRLPRPVTESCCRSRKAWAAADRIFRPAYSARSDLETLDTKRKSHFAKSPGQSLGRSEPNLRAQRYTSAEPLTKNRS